MFMRILRPLTVVTLSVTTLVAGSQLASAETLEKPRNQQGYVLSLGIENGYGSYWEDGDKVGSYPGGSFTLRLGQLLTPRLGLGILISSGMAKDGSEQATMSGLGLEGTVRVAGNWALSANVGVGQLQLKDESVVEEDLRGTFGSMYGLTVRYAWFPFAEKDDSGGFAVTPLLQARYLPDSAASLFTTSIGIELAWWTGLPKHQLDLPESKAYDD